MATKKAKQARQAKQSRTAKRTRTPKTAHSVRTRSARPAPSPQLAALEPGATGTVVFLGAGATKSCGGPLTNQILPGMHERVAASNSGWSLARLCDFLKQEFHVDVGMPAEHYPGLPLLMSLIDTAIDRRQAFNERWDLAALNELRQEVEFGIYDLLEEQLQQSPTNSHWLLFDRLFPAGGEAPCVISTNYDLIADTTLMYLSERRGDGEGGLPDYRCAIATMMDNGASPRFGTLLKLHGSLNWLYCKTCRRLQLGASSAKRYVKVMQRLNGPDVQSMFTPDGDPCPTCRTLLRPLLIAPTHLKDYRNPHLSQVWYEAERVLRAARRVVFVGYSLPDDDIEVVYLLKRSLSRPDVAVTVIEYDADDPDKAARDHAAGRRYRTLFGDDMDWHACGLEKWLRKQ